MYQFCLLQNPTKQAPLYKSLLINQKSIQKLDLQQNIYSSSSGLGAPTGHTAEHVPHSIHFSLSTT